MEISPLTFVASEGDNSLASFFFLSSAFLSAANSRKSMETQNKKRWLWTFCPQIKTEITCSEGIQTLQIWCHCHCTTLVKKVWHSPDLMRFLSCTMGSPNRNSVLGCLRLCFKRIPFYQSKWHPTTLGQSRVATKNLFRVSCTYQFRSNPGNGVVDFHNPVLCPVAVVCVGMRMERELFMSICRFQDRRPSCSVIPQTGWLVQVFFLPLKCAWPSVD